MHCPFLAFHVGDETKGFLILSNHQAFQASFYNKLKKSWGHLSEFPVKWRPFEGISKMVQANGDAGFKQDFKFRKNEKTVCGSSESKIPESHRLQSPI
ncbi:hypothetical protein Nepgr_012585 [Nepenthes gracilis]|uniref:Uncharacterized protein n=1 Tax=Nepenthes gracilis TaxID=150966 RepID=A0AAD3SHJ6_NEPGR|nr:hypothetical protein Nepgr_012585 [Nepenthes gracilis]